MPSEKEIITFKTICKNCKRDVRVFVSDETQFPRCMYCGGELVISNDHKDNVTQVVRTNKNVSTMYDLENTCPVCNRTIGGRGKIGDEFKCRFCGVNFKLMNSAGEVTPFSFGANIQNIETRKLFKTSNITAQQADEVLKRLDELYSDFYTTDYSEIIKLIYIACEKNIFFRKFDVDYVKLIVLNLLPLLRKEIILVDNVFQFPTIADFSAELFSLFLFPKSPPVLKYDPSGFVLVYLSISSFENIRYIDSIQIANMLSILSISSTTILNLERKGSKIEFEGALHYKESVTNAEFFLRMTNTDFNQHVDISNEGKQLLRSRFIESGLLLVFIRLVYGAWFPAYALRYFSPVSIRRIYQSRTGEDIHSEAMIVISRIIANMK